MKKYLLFVVLIGAIGVTPLYAVRIKQPSFWGRLGSALGEGISKGCQNSNQQNNYNYESSCTKFNFDPICSFQSNQNQITLKLIKATNDSYSKDQTRHFSFIVRINEEIRNKCTAYMVLLDSCGFQIGQKIYLERINDGFKGDLRGDFVVRMSEDDRICGAEIRYCD